MLADLHNHSCLSPCATLDMSPALIARIAAANGIDLIALTDHNSARNCPAFKEACRRVGITPLYGLEVTTVEECHVLALFDTLDNAMRMSEWVFAVQPRIPLDVDFFSDQPVVDADENILERIDVFLGAAIPWSLDGVRAQVWSLGGLFIPSHINRPVFSVESQLGFLPSGAYDAIEVMPGSVGAYRAKYPHLPVITASDAHCPEKIGTAPVRLDLSPPVTIASLRAALKRLAQVQ